MELRYKKCIPCEMGTQPLDKSMTDLLLTRVDREWAIENNNKLLREFKFVNFRHAMNFVNQVAEIAEAEGHHPDIYISYGKCRLELWTHVAGGLTENDFILADKIDELKG